MSCDHETYSSPLRREVWGAKAPRGLGGRRPPNARPRESYNLENGQAAPPFSYNIFYPMIFQNGVGPPFSYIVIFVKWGSPPGFIYMIPGGDLHFTKIPIYEMVGADPIFENQGVKNFV